MMFNEPNGPQERTSDESPGLSTTVMLAQSVGIELPSLLKLAIPGSDLYQCNQQSWK
jgi:hypothetical protein